jgi:D-lactate dehydrogenase (cytochrome)
VRHRIKARPAADAVAPVIETDPGVLSSFSSDAAHVAGGFAAGIAFPATERHVSALVKQSAHLLPIGAQSSLTGGATARGETLLSTRALTTLETPAGGTIRVGAGVTLLQLQQHLARFNLWYPPVPTFEGAFVGGAISTNAAGAATFKYGSTRDWVEALTIVLASGDVLDIRRGEIIASADGWFEIESSSGRVVRVPVPGYSMPRVAKLSAGYFAAPSMDLVDLFVGSEGTLGVVVDAMLRVIARPLRALALITCRSEAQAVAVATALRDAARLAWRGDGPLDVAAIEYIDDRALRVLADDAFIRAGIERPPRGSTMLLVQIEWSQEADVDASLGRFATILEEAAIDVDPHVASPGDERTAQRLIELREAVPVTVNARIAAAKRTDAAIEKTAGDMVVPFERIADSLRLYRDAFERRGLDYAVWGHFSDGNLHPNVIPRDLDDLKRGREALLEIAGAVIRMGGAPLAEHGVGRSALKQRMLQLLYGEDGIDEMRAIKRALDPEGKLSPGVLFRPT